MISPCSHSPDICIGFMWEKVEIRSEHSCTVCVHPIYTVGPNSLNNPASQYKSAHPQSRQSAKLFLQSSELRLPQPLTRRRVYPPPPRVLGRRGTLAGERWVGKVPIPTRRGHTLVVRYIYVLCGPAPPLNNHLLHTHPDDAPLNTHLLKVNTQPFFLSVYGGCMFKKHRASSLTIPSTHLIYACTHPTPTLQRSSPPPHPRHSPSTPTSQHSTNIHPHTSSTPMPQRPPPFSKTP
jgi:hypothetical protein